MKAKLTLIYLMMLMTCVDSGANELSSVELADVEINSPVRRKKKLKLEISPLSLMVGSFFTTANYSVTNHFSVGPSFGFHPLYLLTPGNSILAYDLGVDSAISVFGDNFSNSWFINPFIYFSGFHSLRAEQPSVHGGFNIGYRWFLSDSVILSAGVGVKSVGTYLESFSYHPLGRVSEGSVSTFIPFHQNVRFTIGIIL